MNVAKRFHTAPVFERPNLLKRIYFARIIGYASLTGVVAFLHYGVDEKESK